MSNLRRGEVAPNTFLAEFMKEKNLATTEEAARFLNVPAIVFAALLYSPVQVSTHEETERIAEYFGISHDEWFLKWRLGFGGITYDEKASDRD